MTTAPPFYGVATCHAFVVDVTLLGEQVARTRVLTTWRHGDSLRQLPDGRWLHLLGEAVQERCEEAIGLPLTRTTDGGYGPAGGALDVAPGEVRLPVGGACMRWRIADLPVIAPSHWVDVHLVSVLLPLQHRDTAPRETVDRSVPPDVDLRTTVGVRSPSASASAAQQALLQRDGGHPRIGSGQAPGVRPHGRPALGWWDRLVDHVVRSPLGALGSRHERYLERLGRAFEQGDLEEALRDAISLGGAVGRATLKLPPPRREANRPSLVRSEPGRSLRLPTSAHDYLGTLYRRAASDLERGGRIEEAAFVHADLLGAVDAAISLLERHGRIELAAALADGRSDNAGMTVRLLWSAGRRERALEVARAHGAFNVAVVRLSRVDARGAVEMRRAWAETLRDDGDHVGALEVLWGDAHLRAEAAPDIERGLALGGALRAHLLPYALALGPRPDLAEEALDRLSAHTRRSPHELVELLRALVPLALHDQQLDRRLASAAVRALLDPTRPSDLDARTAQKWVDKLGRRADPLLRADTGGMGVPRSAPSSAPLRVRWPAGTGTVAVEDALPMAGGDVLVALGQLGLRQLSPEGRVRATWDVPAHRILAADHGGGVVVGSTTAGGVWTLHRLDLSTRRIRRWVTVPAVRLLDSYDGLTVGLVDEEGVITFLDTAAPSADVVRTELRGVGRVADVARATGGTAALVLLNSPTPTQSGLEMWWWAPPGHLLRGRRPIPFPTGQAGVLPDGTYVRVESSSEMDEPAGPSRLVICEQHRAERSRPLAGDPVLTLRGACFILARHAEMSGGVGQVVELYVNGVDEADVVVEGIGPDQAISFRSEGGRACLWDASGRLVLIDVDGSRLIGTPFVVV